MQKLLVFATGMLGGIYFGRYKDAIWDYLELDKKKQWIDWGIECEKMAEQQACDCWFKGD